MSKTDWRFAIFNSAVALIMIVMTLMWGANKFSAFMGWFCVLVNIAHIVMLKKHLALVRGLRS
jgi:hypothetical protein